MGKPEIQNHAKPTIPPETSVSAQKQAEIPVRPSPHWSLPTAALILLTFLLYFLKDYLSPITLSIAILILLYPFWKNREIRPLIVLVWIIFAFAVWSRLSSLLAPFIIGFIVAYAFEPLVEWLEQHRLPRWLVIVIIILLVISTMGGIGILVVPRLVNEIKDLAGNIPQWAEQAWDWGIGTALPWIERLNLPLEDSLDNMKDKLPGLFTNFMKGLLNWSSSALVNAVGFVSGLANLILIPILSVYFLNEYKKIREWTYTLIPGRRKELAYKLYYNINNVVAAYIRGQLLVCLFLATWIGLGLWLWVGLPYALLLGITAGLANLVPYVGTSIAALLTVTVAVTQPDPIWTLVKTIIVFASAQSLEGNLLTPKIVGNRVGLPALLVIFVVLLCASLFGIIGMLVAIPISASIKVFLEVWLQHRKEQIGSDAKNV